MLDVTTVFFIIGKYTSSDNSILRYLHDFTEQIYNIQQIQEREVWILKNVKFELHMACKGFSYFSSCLYFIEDFFKKEKFVLLAEISSIVFEQVIFR